MTLRNGIPARFALFGAGLALFAGCGGGATSTVKTSPVKGQVVLKNGNVERLSGGQVLFQSVVDARVTAVGTIEDGGQFVMGMFVDGRPVGGVVEGDYLARVTPPNLDPDDEEQPRPPAKGE